jgi:hypothetical protein
MHPNYQLPFTRKASAVPSPAPIQSNRRGVAVRALRDERGGDSN